LQPIQQRDNNYRGAAHIVRHIKKKGVHMYTLAQIANETKFAESRGIVFDFSPDDAQAYRMLSRIGQRFTVSRRMRAEMYSDIVCRKAMLQSRFEHFNRPPADDDGRDYEKLCLIRHENSGMDI